MRISFENFYNTRSGHAQTERSSRFSRLQLQFCYDAKFALYEITPQGSKYDGNED